MRTLLIEVDCGERFCNKCKGVFLGWCDIFREPLVTGRGEYLRLPECLEAERKANQGK